LRKLKYHIQFEFLLALGRTAVFNVCSDQIVDHAGIVSLKKNSGNAEFERRRRENRSADGVEGVGCPPG